MKNNIWPLIEMFDGIINFNKLEEKIKISEALKIPDMIDDMAKKHQVHGKDFKLAAKFTDKNNIVHDLTLFNPEIVYDKTVSVKGIKRKMIVAEAVFIDDKIVMDSQGQIGLPNEIMETLL